jgi:mannose-1-phosphate guanylyltransferase
MSQVIQATPVVLCGGCGTRLWLLFCAGLSKQYLSLTSNENFLSQAVKKLTTLRNSEIQVLQALKVRLS